jgi:radical SAM superfamily enzyme YgiQ (UPF0313 family)
MKKLLLINPVGRKSGLLLSRYSQLPPLSLAYVAAVTPSSWEVKIWDENFLPFVFEEADLVGITAFTTNINRAYELARIYQKKNIKVVMGGIHVSMCPDEALQYCDSVVIGEVEGIWGSVIKDFENKSLKAKYLNQPLDLSNYSIRPRRDLIHPDYLWNSVQTSRGCPFNCHFCSVTNYLGKTYRQRDSDDVLNELEQIDGKLISFLDDNLIGYSSENRLRAMSLFQGMISRGIHKKWWMQTSINAAEDEKLIELAAKAGCLFAFIGFETVDQNTLKNMKKGINLKFGTENYKKIVDVFHKYGISVYGAFILGNDFESPVFYEKLGNFLVSSGIDIIQLSLLTPLPGTNLMEQLEQEGRLIYNNFPEDWEKYRFSYIVHEPKGIEPEIIYAATNFLKKRIYSFPTYLFRMIRSLFSLNIGANLYVTLKYNQALKKGWENSHYYDKYPHTL